MKQNIPLLVVVAVLASCEKRSNKTEIADTTRVQSEDSVAVVWKMETTEDSLKYHMGISDSVAILDAEYRDNMDEGHSRVFIDYNLNSIFHDEIISGYGCDCIDEELYNDVYKKDYEEYKDSITLIREQHSRLMGHWIPIYKYKGDFYFHLILCEYNLHGFTLSDSAFITYDMDGLFPSLLLDIKETEKEISIKTKSGINRLVRIDDESEIYVYNDGYSKNYVVHSRYLNSYKVMAVDCHTVGEAIGLPSEIIPDNARE